MAWDQNKAMQTIYIAILGQANVSNLATVLASVLTFPPQKYLG